MFAKTQVDQKVTIRDSGPTYAARSIHLHCVQNCMVTRGNSVVKDVIVLDRLGRV